MFRPSLSFSGSNLRSCFSAYFTPTFTLFPFVLAWVKRRRPGTDKGASGPHSCIENPERHPLSLSHSSRDWGGSTTQGTGYKKLHPHPNPERPAFTHTHHASQGQKGGLHLRVVGVLEQVVGLKDIVGLHPVLGDGLDDPTPILPCLYSSTPLPHLLSLLSLSPLTLPPLTTLPFLPSHPFIPGIPIMITRKPDQAENRQT